MKTILLIALLNVPTENLVYVDIPEISDDRCISLLKDYAELHIKGSINIIHISCEVPNEREPIKEPNPIKTIHSL